MFISGFIGTAIAILSSRRFDSWWAGLVGVPVALLLCDVKESVRATQFALATIKNAVSSIRLQKTESIKKFLTPSEKTISVFKDLLQSFFCGLTTCTWVISTTFFSAIIISLLWIFMFLYIFGSTRYEGGLETVFPTLIMIAAGIPLLSFSRHIEGSSKSMKIFPINHLFRKFKFFRVWDEPSSPNNSNNPTCSIRDRDERLYSSGEIVHALKETFLGGVPSCLILFLACLFGLFILLIDVILSVLLNVITSKSVSVGAGVIFGLSVDYFLSPVNATAIWFIGCCFLGAVSGWIFWCVREKLLDMPLPSTVYANLANT